MTPGRPKSVEFFAAGAGGGALDPVSESYFAESLMSQRGHGFIAVGDRLVAVSGTRYLTEPIGLEQNGDTITVLNGAGTVLKVVEDATWATGSWRASRSSD